EPHTASEELRARVEQRIVAARAELRCLLDRRDPLIRIHEAERTEEAAQRFHLCGYEPRFRGSRRLGPIVSRAFVYPSEPVLSITDPFEDPDLERSSDACVHAGSQRERMLQPPDRVPVGEAARRAVCRRDQVPDGAPVVVPLLEMPGELCVDGFGLRGVGPLQPLADPLVQSYTTCRRDTGTQDLG